MLTWDGFDESNSGSFSNYEVIRRNGAIVPFEPFEPNKIEIAMMKAFLAVLRTYKRITVARFLSGTLPSSLSHQTAVLKRWILATANSARVNSFMLSEQFGATVKLRPGKASGFFSASKANLRNAP